MSDIPEKEMVADRPRRPIEWVLSLLSCIAILAVAGGLLYLIFANQPKATREGATKKTAMLVRVETVSAGDYQPELQTTGTVMPAREIVLSPRVSGAVVDRAKSFIPGGIVNAGETLVKLDPADYEIAVIQRRSALHQRQAAVSQATAAVKQAAAVARRNEAAVSQAVAARRQANAALAIEQGRQNIAEEDFAFLDQELAAASKSLVLREPQREVVEAELQAAEAEVLAAQAALAASQAQVEAAKADLEAAKADVAVAEAALRQVELDLHRTSIRASFRALVLSREVNLGSQVSAGGRLGRLVDVDEYWVEATVPLSMLPMVEFPREGELGASVRVRDRAGWPEGKFREGRLLTSIGALDKQTRLARVLLSVRDPLGLAEGSSEPQLVLESFVEARIQAKPLQGVFRIKRDYLRNGNKVWVMVDQKLNIRPVKVLFQDAVHAYLEAGSESDSGLRDGEQIVVSQLSRVVEGAALRLEGEESAAE